MPRPPLSDLVCTRLVDLGLARGTDAYRRFVVVTWYRSGSNYLRELLAAGPGVVAYSEVFSPKGPFWGGLRHAPWISPARARAERLRAPLEFLDRWVFRPQPRGTLAVGFKVMTPQLVEKPVPGLLERLRDDGRLRLVLLYRRNLYHQLVSSRLSHATLQTSARSRRAIERAQAAVVPFAPAPAECEAFFTSLTARLAWCRDALPRERTVEIAYEELGGDGLARVQDHIGVPRHDGTARVLRQRTRPVHEHVANHAALAAHFRGTRWAPFFAAEE